MPFKKMAYCLLCAQNEFQDIFSEYIFGRVFEDHFLSISNILQFKNKVFSIVINVSQLKERFPSNQREPKNLSQSVNNWASIFIQLLDIQ